MRWTSTNRVLAKMKRLLPFIGQCDFSGDILQYVPNAVECGLLDSILKDDEPFQSATNPLQRSGSTMLELNEVRTLFDTLIAKVPSVESLTRILFNGRTSRLLWSKFSRSTRIHLHEQKEMQSKGFYSPPKRMWKHTYQKKRMKETTGFKASSTKCPNPSIENFSMCLTIAV